MPQAGGFLVKQVVKDTVGSQIGLGAGNRTAIVEGQKIVVGGDILLAVQGIPMASGADRAKVFKSLESLRVRDDLRFTVFRDDKIVELAMKWTGFPTQFLAPVK